MTMNDPIEEMLQRALERNEVYANPDVPALVKALRRALEVLSIVSAMLPASTKETEQDIAKILQAAKGKQ